MASQPVADESELDPTLVFHVRQYVPDADGVELEHRVSLLKARDWAAGLCGRSQSYLAQNMASEAHQIAGQMVFRHGESEPRLGTAVVLCRRMVGAAMAADGLNSEETPL